MDLRDILIGFFWLVAGNLSFYLFYPMYTSLLDGFSESVIGSFGLTGTITSIGWGGYFFMWVVVGVAIPIYLIVKGASRE